VTVTWKRDEQGVMKGGWVGGDNAVDEAWSVRFIADGEPADGLRALIDSNWYVEQLPEHTAESPAFGVVNMTQYTLCTNLDDPGLTEVWSDITYEDGALVYTTIEAAEATAKANAEGESGDDYGWDGRARSVQ
jgi:hypothetical protein